MQAHMSTEGGPRFYENRRRRLPKLAAVLTATALLVNACSDGEAVEFVGGCEQYGVYAQNRWEPLGTAVRSQPDVLSAKLVPSFAPNEVIAVNGWYDAGEPVYPTNPPPWDSSVWFRLVNRDGWVSFPGVRAEPTKPDPTLMSEEGGAPAPTPPECEITRQP